MRRKIISIDEEKCNGCGLCIPNCPEGALQVIDGKVRLVSDLFCDGLGACIGHCPEGAIAVEEREAASYDEKKVMDNIVRQGENVIRAHLEHLREHGESDLLGQALACLAERGLKPPSGFGPGPEKREKEPEREGKGAGKCAMGEKTAGCPGARAHVFGDEPPAGPEDGARRPSRLRQWPVQLHLVSPGAPYFRKADLLLAADCTAFALGDFHRDWLEGRALVIACPKLDQGQEVYREKIKALVDEAEINTLTVLIMEVPCCRGLLALARQALAEAGRKVPLKAVVVGLRGDILGEEWV